MAMTYSDTANYLGVLYQLKANRTGFLSYLGGLAGGSYATYGAYKFPMGVTYELPSGAQPAIDEETAAAGVTPTTQATAQASNTVQIFHEGYKVSYAKESRVSEITGIALSEGTLNNTALSFQKAAALGRMAINMDYSFLNGSYQEASTTATAAKTRGLVTAISTHSVDASSADLSKDLINQLLVSLTADSDLDTPAMFGGAFQKTQISNIYGFAPESRTVGGVNISRVVTDFGEFDYVMCLHMPASTIVIGDASKIRPVYCPVNGDVIVDEMLAKTGAAEAGQLYMQAGIDYANEKYHGKIVNLTTS